MGAANVPRIEAENTPQTKIGNLVQVIPGARSAMIVVSMFTPDTTDIAVEALVGLLGEGRVPGPARLEATEDGRSEQDHDRRRHQPEGQCLEARKRHSVGSDHVRDEEVTEGPDDGRARDEHHHHAVHADQRQVLVRRNNRWVGNQQARANQHRADAAEQHCDEHRHEVLDSDHLVVEAEIQIAPGA